MRRPGVVVIIIQQQRLLLAAAAGLNVMEKHIFAKANFLHQVRKGEGEDSGEFVAAAGMEKVRSSLNRESYFACQGLQQQQQTSLPSQALPVGGSSNYSGVCNVDIVVRR